MNTRNVRIRQDRPTVKEKEIEMKKWTALVLAVLMLLSLTAGEHR